ncbi:MAG: RagB/SusD family nutrient uptake outer membrane protein [Bacteroidetes bacterium]|nr:RagB/SusD family nutrient uptake outer membrane protein [Bacteroidota bacterium]
MKKILLFLFLAFSAVNCKKDWLDTFPPDGPTPANYYSNAAEALAGLNACYDNLSAQFDRLYGLGIDAIGMYCGDECVGGRTSPRDFSSFEQFNLNGAEVTLQNIWRESYTGIFRCNQLLEKLPDVPMAADLKARYKAEATFLRGFYHFELFKCFGGIPVVTKVLTPDDARVARNTRAETIAQIESDFKSAIPDLPQKSKYAANDLGRITKGAAQAYLMKLYIFDKRWNEAVAVGQEVINSNEYSLFADYNDNFNTAKENGSESIFEVQCKTGTATGEGNAHYDLESFENTPNPRGYTQPFASLRNSFQNNAAGAKDPRRDFSIKVNIISSTLLTSFKYNRPQTPQPAVQYDGELNYKLMRYADFLLLFAEAQNEAGNTTEALKYLNLVRQRANVNMPALNNLSQQQFRQAIYDERKWELAFEGHRYFDLVRWGIAGAVLRAQGRNFVDGKHELMPIPTNEITLNPKLAQNPMY